MCDVDCFSGIMLGIITALFVILYIVDQVNYYRKYKQFVKDIEIGNIYHSYVKSVNPFDGVIEYEIIVLGLKEGWIKYKKLFKDRSYKICTCEVMEFAFKYMDEIK